LIKKKINNFNNKKINFFNNYFLTELKFKFLKNKLLINNNP